MRKFIFIILFLIIAIAGGVIGAAFYFGMETEKLYKKLVENLAKDNGFKVVEKRYDRGLFSSHVETDISLIKAPTQLRVVSTIHHGPFALNDILKGDLTQILKPIRARIESKIDVLNASDKKTVRFTIPVITYVDILGAGVIDINLPPNTQQFGNVTTRWKTINGYIKFGKQMDRFETKVHIPMLSITSRKNITTEIAGLVYTSDSQLGVTGYRIGGSKLTIKSLSVNPFFKAGDIEYEAKVSEKGKHIIFTTRSKFGLAKLGNKQFGPGQIDLVIRNIDAASLVAYNTKTKNLHKDNLNEQQATIKSMGNIMGLVLSLAKYSPEVEITKLNLKTDSGTLTGQAKIVLDGNNQAIGKHPMLLLTAINGAARVDIPPGLIQPLLARHIQRDLEAYTQNGKLTEAETNQLTPEIISKIAQQALPLYLDRNDFTKLLVYENNKFILNAKIERGKILINNKPWQGKFPLPMAKPAVVAN